MSVEETTARVPADKKQPYLWGGIAALVLAVGYIVIIPLYAHVGSPPNGGEAWFKYLPGKTTIWWTILGISVFTDILYLPLALALYLALKEVNKNAMALACARVARQCHSRCSSSKSTFDMSDLPPTQIGTP